MNIYVLLQIIEIVIAVLLIVIEDFLNLLLHFISEIIINNISKIISILTYCAKKNQTNVSPAMMKEKIKCQLLNKLRRKQHWEHKFSESVTQELRGFGPIDRN